MLWILQDRIEIIALHPTLPANSITKILDIGIGTEYSKQETGRYLLASLYLYLLYKL